MLADRNQSLLANLLTPKMLLNQQPRLAPAPQCPASARCSAAALDQQASQLIIFGAQRMSIELTGERKVMLYSTYLLAEGRQGLAGTHDEPTAMNRLAIVVSVINVKKTNRK